MKRGRESLPEVNLKLPRHIVVLLICCTVLPSAVAQEAESLVEMGSFLDSARPVAGPLKFATYNVGGPLTQNAEAVYRVLADGAQPRGVHVWALQEVRTSSERNFAREMAEKLKLHYAHAIARERGGGWEGLSFLSRLPLSRVERLELPHLDTGDRRRIALFATVSSGPIAVRLCNVHLPIRMSHDKREEQMSLILDRLASEPEDAQIILGDFNTITGGLRRLYHRRLSNAGFDTPFEGNSKTFQRYFFLRFKLDWIYLQGLTAKDFGIEQQVKASDHRPVWVTVR